MNPSELPDHIFDLIQQKPFSALSNTEKEEVLNHVSEDTYAILQETVSLFSEADTWQKAGVKPAKAPGKGILYRMLNYQIPLYQAAAVLLFLLGAFYLTNQNDAEAKDNNLSNSMAQNVSLAEGYYPEWLIFER